MDGEMNDQVGIWMDKWMHGRERRKGDEEKGDWCLRRWCQCWMKMVAVLRTTRHAIPASSGQPHPVLDSL